jgi:hypothetical protein
MKKRISIRSIQIEKLKNPLLTHWSFLALAGLILTLGAVRPSSPNFEQHVVTLQPTVPVIAQVAVLANPVLVAPPPIV